MMKWSGWMLSSALALLPAVVVAEGDGYSYILCTSPYLNGSTSSKAFRLTVATVDAWAGPDRGWTPACQDNSEVVGNDYRLMKCEVSAASIFIMFEPPPTSSSGRPAYGWYNLFIDRIVGGFRQTYAYWIGEQERPEQDFEGSCQVIENPEALKPKFS